MGNTNRRAVNQQPPRQDEAEPGRSRESQAAAYAATRGQHEACANARPRGQAVRRRGVAERGEAGLLLPRVGTLGNTVVGGGGQLSRA
eukprot:scaffold9460_cov49-Phaeocystis_antarctica.AAC.3